MTHPNTLPIGSVRGGYKLLERLPTRKLRVQCLHCGTVKAITKPGFTNNLGGCSDCGHARGRAEPRTLVAYSLGDVVGHWAIIGFDRSLGHYRAQCDCGSAPKVKSTADIRKHRWCRDCYNKRRKL